jgi:Fur family ferric uptake transcriptional regulator
MDDYYFEKPVKQKDLILAELKKQGCRITKQRNLIIDIILGYEYTSCKEIHWQVVQKDPTVGIATVYRMIKALEDIGALNRQFHYKVFYDGMDGESIIILKNGGTVNLPAQKWINVIKAGLNTVCGIKDHEIEAIVMKK